MTFCSPPELEATELVEDMGRNPASMVAGTETFYQPPAEEQCVLLLSPLPPTHTYTHTLRSALAATRLQNRQTPTGCFSRTTWEPAGSHCLGLSQSRRTNPGSSCPRPERDLLLYMLRDIVIWVLSETVLLCSPGWSEIHYVAHTGLEHQNQLLPRLPE